MIIIKYSPQFYTIFTHEKNINIYKKCRRIETTQWTQLQLGHFIFDVHNISSVIQSGLLQLFFSERLWLSPMFIEALK
jgi:hypothetical protein